MTQRTLKQRFRFDVLLEPEDRLAHTVLLSMAYDGHGDWGGCGVAEFNLNDFADAIGWAPGATLRRLKDLAPTANAVCVEHDNIVLFALAGAQQDGFSHLYKSRGFEGLQPSLPHL
ncbi:hypothetical protein FG93_00977 [Bosea sp. LC85]|uniref:hypothetical protein n=1 Tax=Bosea sp. LC85 TaxID=1502851 RepID=UPI0004E31626|nr:hypothetical protein [Bosea sp. LC85]KFC74798.1 hypothetical protein FG93_00977 [Bosea sp. LC85]